MPKVVDAARVTTKDGAVWRECAGCGRLSALAPEATRCKTCDGLAFTPAELDQARAVLTDVVRGDATRLDRLRSMHAYLTGYLGATVTALVAGEPLGDLTRRAAALYAVHQEVTR